MEIWEIFELAAVVGVILYELKSRAEVAELRGEVTGLVRRLDSLEMPDVPDVTDIKIEQARLAMEQKHMRSEIKRIGEMVE